MATKRPPQLYTSLGAENRASTAQVERPVKNVKKTGVFPPLVIPPWDPCLHLTPPSPVHVVSLKGTQNYLR